MICINLSIKNPAGTDKFNSLWNKCRAVTRNKTAEIQLYRWSFNILELRLDTSWQGHDHAGPSFEVGIGGIYFTFSITDNRHWDTKSKSWETYSE